MNNHDKKQIEKLKELKKEYHTVCSLSKKERIKRFCETIRGERRIKNDNL